MKRYWARFITVAALGCLLALWALPASAYYPPLQATANWDWPWNWVHRSVYDPKLNKLQELTSQWGGQDVGIADLKQQNGVISWILRNGATYFVYYSVYDPDLAKFKEDIRGPFTSVSQLQVVDGVVAYVGGIPPSTGDPTGHPEFRYATYDPSKSAWQHRSFYESNVNSYLELITKDGVVVCHYRYWLPGEPTDMVNFAFSADIYDPLLGKWIAVWNGHSGKNLTRLGMYIMDATIYYQYYGYNPEIEGYTWNQYSSSWLGGTPTNPMAYFVAQPKLGTKPMWVWFTDMSFGGTTWNWNFDDNNTSTNRSPYHTFTSSGTFWVSQQISGPNGSNTYTQPIIVAYPIVLKKKLPGVLYLLLTAD